MQHANLHPFGVELDPTAFQWDDWEPGSEVVLADPTPSDRWQPGTDDPLGPDLNAESLVWAPQPTGPPTQSRLPDATL